MTDEHLEGILGQIKTIVDNRPPTFASAAELDATAHPPYHLSEDAAWLARSMSIAQSDVETLTSQGLIENVSPATMDAQCGIRPEGYIAVMNRYVDILNQQCAITQENAEIKKKLADRLANFWAMHVSDAKMQARSLRFLQNERTMSTFRKETDALMTPILRYAAVMKYVYTTQGIYVLRVENPDHFVSAT